MEALSVIPLHKKEILNIFEDVLALNLADRKTFFFLQYIKELRWTHWNLTRFISEDGWFVWL